MMRSSLRNISIVATLLSILVVNSLSSKAGAELSWTEKTTNDTNKTWTIYFNQPVRTETVSLNSIFVIDETNKRVQTNIKVSSDQKSLMVSPKSSYKSGKKYWLYIDKSVRSSKNRDTLQQSLWMPFVIASSKDTESLINEKKVEKPSKSNLKVTFEKTQFFTNIKVIADPSVTKIILGRSSMQYKGNNSFTLAIAGIDKGDNLLFKAYDGDNSLLFKETVKME